MINGINRALDNTYKTFNERYASIKKPCIFLSHRSLDKDMVEIIGKYIMSKGIDIYFDKYDKNLQRADAEGNDEATTKCIQEGLKESTHVMCILSKITVTSWWVPYEIGYGENIAKDIFSLKLAELRKEDIPAYLRIRECLMGWSELDNYLLKLAIKYSTLNESECEKYKYKQQIYKSASVHPLSQYLDM